VEEIRLLMLCRALIRGCNALSQCWSELEEEQMAYPEQVDHAYAVNVESTHIFVLGEYFL